MTIFCQYTNIFGVPNKGVHSWKIGGTAMVDYLLTIIGSIIISYYTNYPLVLVTIFFLLLGIFLHYLFGVNTKTIKYFGLKLC
jgi:hypothetical protein